MMYCVSVVDALFGKRTLLEFPSPDGTARRIKVTERWLGDMAHQGKLHPAEGVLVIAHVIDPTALARLMVEPVDSTALWFARLWTIGRDLSLQEYERWRDPETGRLYSYLKSEKGATTLQLVERRRWEALRSMLKRF